MEKLLILGDDYNAILKTMLNTDEELRKLFAECIKEMPEDVRNDLANTCEERKEKKQSWDNAYFDIHFYPRVYPQPHEALQFHTRREVGNHSKDLSIIIFPVAENDDFKEFGSKEEALKYGVEGSSTGNITIWIDSQLHLFEFNVVVIGDKNYLVHHSGSDFGENVGLKEIDVKEFALPSDTASANKN